MIKKIFVFLIPCMLVIAVFLKINGVQQLEFNDDYFRFFSSVLERQNAWTIAIPNIPMIETASFVVGWLDLSFIANVLNFFVGIVNTLSGLINACIGILTFLVSLFVSIVDSIKGLFLP